MCVFESQIHNLLLLWMVMYKCDFCEAWSRSKSSKIIGAKIFFFVNYWAKIQFFKEVEKNVAMVGRRRK